MEGSSFRDLADLIGALVYCVSYVPIWVTWNVVGKHVVRAFESVRGQTDRMDTRAVIEQGSSLETLRQMIANAYYNRVLIEEKRCVRSA